MKRRFIAAFLVLVLLFNQICVTVYADESDKKTNSESEDKVIDPSSIAPAASSRTVDQVIAQSKYTQRNGHGFAAENTNNFIDGIKGKNASVVGDNNVKNGPDRKIINRDGSQTFIQDKYYRTAKESIDACFDESGFRYLDGEGNPMEIEVPSDQYEKAVQEMATKIKEGKVPGVSDPEEAKNIVRKGNVSYEQAKNLAKAGTVDSLKYDAANGVISAGVAFGISALLNYSICRLNGEDREEAIKDSAKEGLRTGCGVFCAAVIAQQLSKTGLMNAFKPSSEALMEAFGDDFAEKFIKAFGKEVLREEGAKAATEAATKSVAKAATEQATKEAAKNTVPSVTKQAAKLLRGEVLVAVVTTIVFTVPDTIDLFRGRISKKQFVKNFAKVAVGVTAGAIGGGLGGALGNLVVPGVGTVPGAIVGSILFGVGGDLAADKIADYITEDDADEMYDITEKEFCSLCEDYMVSETEAKNIVNALNDKLDDNMFKNMYQSENREKYIRMVLVPLFIAEVEKREKIEAPTEEEMRAALKKELKGVVFIH